MTNDTEAPTSEATVDALAAELALPAGLSTEDLDFISLMDQFWAINGRLMTEEESVERYLFEEGEFAGLIGKESVRNALEQRGISGKALAKHSPPVGNQKVPGPSWVDSALTPHQLLVANAMLDLVDTRSEKKKLQDLKVSTKTYAKWLADPVFYNYMRERAEALLGTTQHEAHLALIDKVKAGDLGAIKYFNEITGRFISQSGQFGTTVNVGLGGNKSESRQILIEVLEIIQDEVTDPETAVRIADRFKMLINRDQVARQLVGEPEPIVIPKVKENRELTPRLQELMEAGEGNE